MANKHLSVIIVPHTKTSTKTLCFSRKTLKILSIGGIVLGLALLTVLIDYVRMSVIRGRYQALRVETAEQKSTIEGYEKSITELQTKLSHLESYTKKLNVMAGLKSPDVLTAPAGVGGGEPGKDDPEPYLEPAAAAKAPGGPQVIGLGTVQSSTSSKVTACAWPRPRPSCRPPAGSARSTATGTTPSRGPG